MPDINQKVWDDPDTFATVLLTLLVDKYGTKDSELDTEKLKELFELDPETINLLLIDEGIHLSAANFGRLMVAILIHTTDRFFVNLRDFILCCNVLSGDTYDPAHNDPADSLEIAWGITETLLMTPPDEDEPFNKEILGYIGEVTKSEGMLNPPDVLRIGLQNENLQARVQQTFGGDPEMLHAIAVADEAKSQEVTRALRTRLQNLIAQLNSLKLTNGATVDAVAQLVRSVTPRSSTSTRE